jgi:hypothetical protein
VALLSGGKHFPKAGVSQKYGAAPPGRARRAIPGFLLFILAAAGCSLFSVLYLSERSKAGARDEALIRASSLARAAYLRLLEARQEPAALLFRYEAAEGESRFVGYSLPWTPSRMNLYFADTPHGLRPGAAGILQPSGHTNGRPFWLLPSRLAEDRDFFFTTEERLRQGARALAGLDSFLFRSGAGGFEITQGILPQAAAAPPATSAPSVAASARAGDLAASQRFFERQRALDRQRAELQSLLGITARDMSGLSLSIVSDTATMFWGYDGTQNAGARLTSSALRNISFFAERESELARSFSMGERSVRAVAGYSQNAGLVIVDLAFDRVLSPIELWLFLASVFVPFAAFFAFAHSRGWIHTRQFFLLLLIFSCVSGIFLCREAYADYQNRTYEMEHFLADFAETHGQGDQALFRAHPGLWRDFTFSDMAQKERQGAYGIYIITAGTQLIALLGVIFLAPFMRLLRSLRGLWWAATMFILGVAALFAFSGAIFIAFPEYADSSSASVSRLTDILLTGIALLIVQIIIAYPLSSFLYSRSRRTLAFLFALLFFPFFLSSILFEFFSHTLSMTEGEQNMLWHGMRFFAALPFTLFGLVFARRKIARSVQRATLLAGTYRWRGLFAYALPFFAMGYYLLIDSYPFRAQGIMEVQAKTLTDLILHGVSFMPLVLLTLAALIALCCAQAFISFEPYPQAEDESV